MAVLFVRGISRSLRTGTLAFVRAVLRRFILLDFVDVPFTGDVIHRHGDRRKDYFLVVVLVDRLEILPDVMEIAVHLPAPHPAHHEDRYRELGVHAVDLSLRVMMFYDRRPHLRVHHHYTFLPSSSRVPFCLWECDNIEFSRAL